MLELIVLGQVPGTNIIITFNWVLVISATLLIAYEIARVTYRRRSSDNPTPKINEIAL